MSALMGRDIDIYRILSSGPATRESLYDTYRKSVLKIKDNNLAESDEPKGKNKLGKNGLFLRLWRLKKSGYLKSQQYSRRDSKGLFALYALTQDSADILCEHADYKIESIRMALPPKSRVSHDLQVTDVVRAIKREGGRFPYEYLIMDEDWLRKTAQKKKQSFSDLFARVRLNIGGKETPGNFHIEIDNNTIAPLYVKEKVRKMIYPTLILCTTSKRKENLRNFLKIAYDVAVGLEEIDKTPDKNIKKVNSQKDKYQDKNLKEVYFALTSDFCASNGGGFLNTKWETIAGTRAKIFQL